MFALKKQDGVIVTFTTKEGMEKTLKAFPKKYKRIGERIDDIPAQSFTDPEETIDTVEPEDIGETTIEPEPEETQI